MYDLSWPVKKYIVYFGTSVIFIVHPRKFFEMYENIFVSNSFAEKLNGMNSYDLILKLYLSGKVALQVCLVFIDYLCFVLIGFTNHN